MRFLVTHDITRVILVNCFTLLFRHIKVMKGAVLSSCVQNCVALSEFLPEIHILFSNLEEIPISSKNFLNASLKYFLIF